MSREVPSGWVPTTLGDLTTISGGTTPSREVEEFWAAGQHFWATPTDVTALPLGKVELSSTKAMVGDAALQKTSLKMLPVGSVLVTSRATIGYPAINTVPMATNQGFANFHPSGKYDALFLAYWIAFSRKSLERSAGGSTFPELSKSALKTIPINLPPLHEQRRIAEILSSVDDAIAATRAVIEQTRKVKQGVLECLLTKGIGHTRFKQTEIGEIPEGWEVVELIDVSEAITVGIASSATHAYRSNGIPLLRNQNIKAGALDLSDLLFVSSEYDAENASKRVKTGDIVSMRTGYPGRSAVIPPELDGCQTFTTLVTKPKPSLINSDFLCAWINSDGGMSQVRRLQAGGAQQNLNAGALTKLLVPLPPLKEQQQIALSSHSLLFDEEQEIGALSRLKSALMSDLLTGRKRVTDALPMAAE